MFPQLQFREFLELYFFIEQAGELPVVILRLELGMTISKNSWSWSCAKQALNESAFILLVFFPQQTICRILVFLKLYNFITDESISLDLRNQLIKKCRDNLSIKS